MSDPVIPAADTAQSAAEPTVRLSAARRREQLISISRQLFAERGFDATSIEEVAARAKVSKPIVYQHFGGKEGLYAVVADREVRSLLDRVGTALTAGHPRDLLEQSALALLDYIEEETDGFRVLVREAPVMSATVTGDFSSVLSDLANRVEHILGAEFKARGYDPKLAELYSQALVGMMGVVSRWWLDVRKPRKATVAAHMVNLAWNGLSHLELKPVLATRSNSPAQGNVSAAQSQELNPSDDPAMLLEQVRTVVAEMQDSTPGELVTDADGDIGLRVGTAMVFVRVREQPLLVDVFSPVLTDIAPNEELYRKLSEMTNQMAVGRLYHADNTVWASVQVVGSNFQRSHLVLALQVMTELVDVLDDRLQSEFGGRRFFVEDDNPSRDGGSPNTDEPPGVTRIDSVLGATHNHAEDFEDPNLPSGYPTASMVTSSIAVDAYLDTNERAVAQQVLDALDEVALLLGYEGPVEEQWFDGSVWRRAKAIRKSGTTSEELRSRLIKVERAIELAYVETRQAEIDAKTAEAVTRLITSLNDVPQACLRVGSILIVKYHDDRDGTPILFTRNLSQLEIRALERYPEIQTKPRAVLEALAAVIDTLTPTDREGEPA